MRRVLTLAILWILMWAVASAVHFAVVALFGPRFTGSVSPAVLVSSLMLASLVGEAVNWWRGRRASRT